MKSIAGITHIFMGGGKMNDFNDAVARAIKDMERQRLEVEVQYQQSDNACSALILGRKEI